MSFQGKQLTSEVVEMVVRLKQHHDEERKAGKLVSTQNPAGRTAKALGLGVASVKRIMARYTQAGDEVVVHISKPPGRPPSRIGPSVQPTVRQFVREENLEGRRVSVEKVGSYLSTEHDIKVPKTTLWRALNRWGFTHGEGRRRDSLKEQDRVILARRDYLRAKIANRNEDATVKRSEVYLDETYINKNHSSPFTLGV
jgi:transposase